MLLQYVYDHAAKSGEAVLSSGNTAKALLETALKTCDKTQKVYIIIDGLDEYSREDRKEISTWFKEQVRNIPTNDLGALRCLFISQDDGYARKDLSDCSSIKLTPSDTRDDIEAYCEMWQQLIVQKFKLLDPKEHNISTIITARAQGTLYQYRICILHAYDLQVCFSTRGWSRGIFMRNRTRSGSWKRSAQTDCQMD